MTAGSESQMDGQSSRGYSTCCLLRSACPRSQPAQAEGDTVPAAGCTRPVGWAQAYQGSRRFLACFLCSMAGAASGGGTASAGDEAAVGKSSSARLAFRLQVAVHPALTARNLDLNLTAES